MDVFLSYSFVLVHNIVLILLMTNMNDFELSVFQISIGVIVVSVNMTNISNVEVNSMPI